MMELAILMENEAIPVRLISFKAKKKFQLEHVKSFLKPKLCVVTLVQKLFVMKKNNDAARAYFKLYQDAGKNVT